MGAIFVTNAKRASHLETLYENDGPSSLSPYRRVRESPSASTTLARCPGLGEGTPTYGVLLFTDRFSRADMYAVTDAKFTAEANAGILVNKYIALWGYPLRILWDNGRQYVSQLSVAILARLKVRRITTIAYHPNGNGGIERVNHTMAQMLSVVVSERQDDWELHLHVGLAYNNSVSAAAGLAPNQVHMGRILLFPLTVFDNIYE